MARKDPVLKTKHLILTPLTDEALEALGAAQTDPELANAYAEMLSLCRSDPANRLWSTAWRVSLKSDPAGTVGNMGFKGATKNGRVELGYGIDEPFRNQGYATEAARAMIDWAFGQPDVYIVEAEAAADNAASLRVLEKLKFQPAGQGEEGPRFRILKPATTWMAVFLCLGVAVGLSFGSCFDNQGVGMCLGMCFGMLVGVLLDGRERTHRAKILGTDDEA